jgi:hypothetical protein
MLMGRAVSRLWCRICGGRRSRAIETGLERAGRARMRLVPPRTDHHSASEGTTDDRSAQSKPRLVKLPDGSTADLNTTMKLADGTKMRFTTSDALAFDATCATWNEALAAAVTRAVPDETERRDIIFGIVEKLSYDDIGLAAKAARVQNTVALLLAERRPDNQIAMQLLGAHGLLLLALSLTKLGNPLNAFPGDDAELRKQSAHRIDCGSPLADEKGANPME